MKNKILIIIATHAVAGEDTHIQKRQTKRGKSADGISLTLFVVVDRYTSSLTSGSKLSPHYLFFL